MRIVFMGTPEFAKGVLQKLIENKKNIIMVVTQPDKKVGRKKTIAFSPVKELAIKYSIPCFQPRKVKDEIAEILVLRPDLIITAAYGQMLPKELLDQVMVLNVHGSILPKYRGGAPIQHALINGEKEVGVTIMKTALKMDSGPIIKIGRLKVLEEDDYGSLSIKLSELGANLLIDTLENPIIEIVQNESEATYAPILTFEDEVIDFSQTTNRIINRLKALLPTPGGSFYHKSTWFKIYKIKKSDIITHEEVPLGTIISLDKQLIIKTKDGTINILEIQQAGKKRMHIKDFLNGQNVFKENERIEGKKIR